MRPLIVAILILSPSIAQASEPSRARAVAATLLAYSVITSGESSPILAPAKEPAKPDAPSEKRVPIPYKDAHSLYESERVPMIVMITAGWCPACPELKDTLERLNQQDRLGGSNLVILDYDANKRLSGQLVGTMRISLPTLVYYYHDGDTRKSRRTVGSKSEAEVLRWIGAE